MGPHFDRADKKIGRTRLPHGYVAVLDDVDRLGHVILEIHDYAMAGAHVSQPRMGVLFRRANSVDRDGITRKLIEHFGAAELLDRAAVFGVGDGYHYVIDSESIAHAWNRHSDPVTERRLGQVPLGRIDLVGIPPAVRSRNIVEFAVTKGVPRIVYEHAIDGGTIRVVVEVQHGRQWLVVRTAYKRK